MTTITKVTAYSAPPRIARSSANHHYKPVDVDQTPGADELLRELAYLQLPVAILTGTWDGRSGFRPDYVDAL